MFEADWIKDLNESYISNVRNASAQELTEAQLIEEANLMHLEIIVESIENTFDIELTEEEIQKIYEQIQLNEFIGVAARLGWTLGKRLVGMGLQAGGKKLAQTTAHRTARTAAIKSAKEATKKAQDDAVKAWIKGGRKGDIPFVADIAPKMPKRSALSKFGTKAQQMGNRWNPTFKTAEGKKLGVVRGGIRQAGYKGAWDATKAATKQTAQGLKTLATGAMATYTLGSLLSGPESAPGSRGSDTRGGSRTTTGETGELDTDWEARKYKEKRTGTRKEAIEYVSLTTDSTVNLLESMYDVKLNEEQVAFLAYNIGKRFI